MRISAFLLACAVVLALAGCKTTVTTKRVHETEMKAGPARVVDAGKLEEEGGVTSKPAEPEKPNPWPATAGQPAAGPAPAEGGSRRFKPSAFEPDEKAAKARERATPLFEPMRKAGEVDPEGTRKLLGTMKPEVEKADEARAKKMDELVSRVRSASGSKSGAEKAQEKFQEAEKLYSEKKHKEAAGAYREVLDVVPTHKEALERLKQCYADMEKEGKQVTLLKKPATAQEMLLLEQKFSSAVRLYDEDCKDEAFAKFKKVVEMIEWSPAKIDTKNILGKAREYIERMKIEEELATKPPQKKEEKQEKKPEEKKPAQDKAPEQPGKPEEPQEPGPGKVAPF